MRAEVFRGNAVDNLPRCPFCNVNVRRLKGVVGSLGIVFLVACLAFALCAYFDSQGTALRDFNGKMNAKTEKKIGFLEFQVFQLKTALDSIEYILEKFKNTGGPNEDMIKAVIKNELDIYDSDKTGITDYALENLGGCIISTRDTKIYSDRPGSVTLFGIPLLSFPPDPKAILQPSTQPGDCWSFEGDRGRVVIKLMDEVIVTAISLEHISKKLSPFGDISSAPKEFSLYGLSCLDDDMPHFFGSFTYSEKGPTVQTFSVKIPSQRPFELVEVLFLSNHGNKLFTCVYRVRIHGKLPDFDKKNKYEF